jgi:hypothetical protein
MFVMVNTLECVTCAVGGNPAPYSSTSWSLSLDQQQKVQLQVLQPNQEESHKRLAAYSTIFSTIQ